MVEKILAALDGLKWLPHRHSIELRPTGTPNARRTLPVWPYVIFFRVLDEEKVVLIMTIRHGARHRPKRLR